MRQAVLNWRARLRGLIGPVILGLALAWPIAAVAARPMRIVSLNACTDQLLLQLVERKRIVSLSHLARDETISAMAAEAAGIPMNHATAEEIIALKPDMVVAGTSSSREAVSILRRLGYKVVEFPPAETFEAIKANLQLMGRTVGETLRAERMAAAIDAELAKLPPPPRQRPVFASYQANGRTAGRDTLTGEAAALAGFDILAERLGLTGTRKISLEQMLVSRPDVVDLGLEFHAFSLATENFGHPAMRILLKHSATIGVPAKYTVCGTMRTLDALRMFVAARRKLP